MAHEDKFVQVGRLKTRYLEEGSGPAVILLHGASLGSSADVFTRNLSSLARAGLRVIAYDQPGFGLTDNPGDYSVAYRRRFIMMFMDALALERAALVGHSQAGSMAVALAFEYPQRISKVMIPRHRKPLATYARRSKTTGRARGRRRHGGRTVARTNARPARA